MSGRRLRAQAGMELRLLLRNGENLLVTLAIPTALLAFFALVDVVDLPEPRLDFLVPGVLALAVMSTALVSLAISTGFERSWLVLKRLGATPLTRAELVAAKGVAVVAVEGLQLLVLGGVALALGWRPAARPAGAAAAVLAVLLATAAFAGVGLALAGRLRALATLAVTNALYVVLLATSGIVFPLSRLPGALSLPARLLPSGLLVGALRPALGGAAVPRVVLGALAVEAVVAVAAAVVLFRWE